MEIKQWTDFRNEPSRTARKCMNSIPNSDKNVMLISKIMKKIGFYQGDAEVTDT